LLVGAELLLARAQTLATVVGGAIVLSANAESIFYSWDGENFSEYTAPLAFQPGALYAYATDGEFTEQTRTFTFSAPIRNPDGTSGGTIKLPTGLPGGVVKNTSGASQ
jgi:hypothetical protein